jgi:hypothetical protein
MDADIVNCDGSSLVLNFKCTNLSLSFTIGVSSSMLLHHLIPARRKIILNDTKTSASSGLETRR